jgi:hypothetical protein
MSGTIRLAATAAAFSAALTATDARAQEEPAEEEAYEYEYLEESDIRAALEETLAQPEFARLRAEPEKKKEETDPSELPGWLDRLVRWLARVFGGDEAEGEEPSSRFALDLPGARFLIYLMAFVILAAAVFFIAKSVLAAARDRKLATEAEAGARVFGPAAAPGEIEPDEYWRRALAHGEARRYRDGLRELLLGSMSALERRGLIRFRRGLTNRDYFYSARGPVRDSFASIASAFEHVYFGRREATADAFRECCRAYQKSFREASS